MKNYVFFLNVHHVIIYQNEPKLFRKKEEKLFGL